MKNLKQLRLCCHGFAKHGARYLFCELWIYMTETSFGKMRMVASHPMYRHMVHELKIFPSLLTNPLYTNEDEKEVRAGVGNAQEISAEERDAAYGRLTAIWNEQHQLSGHIEPSLRTAMDCFTRLYRITSPPGEDFVKGELTQLPLPDESDLHEDPHMLHGDGRHQNERYLINSERNIALVLRAIAASRPLACGILREVAIFDSFSIVVMSLKGGMDFQLVKRLVTQLTSFSLNLYSEYQNWWFDSLVKSNDFRRVLEWSSPTLQKLCIHSHQNYPNETEFFSTFHWQRLSTLSLNGLKLDGSQFIAFLQCHKLTLTALHLSYITLVSASWHEIFTNCRGGAIASIEFKGLFVGDAEEICFPCDNDDKERWQKVHRGLHAFIIDEEPWDHETLPTSLLKVPGTEGEADEADEEEQST